MWNYLAYVYIYIYIYVHIQTCVNSCWLNVNIPVAGTRPRLVLVKRSLWSVMVPVSAETNVATTIGYTSMGTTTTTPSGYLLHNHHHQKNDYAANHQLLNSTYALRTIIIMTKSTRPSNEDIHLTC